MYFESDSQTQTVFYTLAAVLTTTALILVMCNQSGTAALVSSISILSIVVMLTMEQSSGSGGAAVVAIPSSSRGSSEISASAAKAAAAAKALKEWRKKRKAQAEAANADAEEAEADADAEAEVEADAGAEVEAEAEAEVEAEAKAEVEAEAEAEAEAADAEDASAETPTAEEGGAPPVEPVVATTMAAAPRAKKPAAAAAAAAAAAQRGGSRALFSSAADVPGNDYVGMPKALPSGAPAYYMPVPPRMDHQCSSAKLVLPIVMEGELPYGPRAEDYGGDNLTSCGGNVATVPPLPPMPGLALPPGYKQQQQQQPNGESVWRVPEAAVDQCSREGSIAAVVSGLPECCQQTPMEVIRNQGLYGVKGNLSCDKLKRSTVADFGFIEPLGARNAFLAYNAYDQLHAKDQFMIPVNKEQPE